MTWKIETSADRMHSLGIDGERELRGQTADAGSHGKMTIKMEYVCISPAWSFCGMEQLTTEISFPPCKGCNSLSYQLY